MRDPDFGDIKFKKPTSRFNFSCTGCADCCKNMKLKLNSLDVKLLCDRLDTSTERFHSRYTVIAVGKNGLPEYMLRTMPQCVFYNEGKGCIVHKSRPMSCRLYPFGSYNVFNKTYFFKVRHCPGFKNTKKITINGFIKENDLEKYINFINNWEVVSNVKLKNKKNQKDFINLYKQLLFFFDSKFTKRFIKGHGLKNYSFEDKIMYFINHLLESM